MEFYTHTCDICNKKWDIEDADRCTCITQVVTDENAVDIFAKEMKKKLAIARQKGLSGWNDKELYTDAYLAELFWEHMYKGNKGNFIDLANFLMFFYIRGAREDVLNPSLRDLQDENENLAYENRRMGDFLEQLGYSIDTITDLIINGRQEDWEELLKDKNVNKNTK